MHDPIIIRLTQAELHLLMVALDIETLPGIAPDLLAGKNEEQRREALEIADQTLRARRFVGWAGTTKHVINPQLAMLLYDYAQPHHTLFVDTYLPNSRGIPFIYAFSQQGMYEQCQPEPDILQFRVISAHDELRQRLSPRLPDEQLAGHPRWHGSIKQKLLNSGLRVVRQDARAAYSLFATELPFELAAALAVTYHSPRVVQYMACWEATPTEEHPAPLAVLTIVQGNEHSFLLWVEQPEQEEESPVSVQLFRSTSLAEYIENILSPLQR